MTLDDKIEQATAMLRRESTAFQRGIIAFSSGKDSIVAADLVKRALNLTDAVCDNSFWFIRHQRDAQRVADQIGLRVQYVDRFGWKYLKDHPNWLFAPEKEQSAMYGARQQKTVKSFALANNYDAVIYGRRVQENTVKAESYRTGDGLLQLHPLRLWSHEDIWAYIDRYGLHIPAIYAHPIGMQDGSTPANFLVPAKYERTPEQLIQDFCPETHQVMAHHGLFDLYTQRLHGTAQA